MTKLEELIEKLCPNGVEYVKIESITNYEQPTSYIVKSTKYDDSYDIPVLTAGQTFILGYTNETNGVYNASKENPIIIFDDFTGAFKWVDFPFKVKSSAMKMIAANKKNILNRYLYHIMGYLNYTSNEHKRLWISIYSQIEIPLPPLQIQEEIVRILDKFTTLTAELQAELQARRQQYEYYRDTLLTLSANYEPKKLNEISLIFDGTHSTPKYTNFGVPFVSVENIDNYSSSHKYISKEDYNKFKIKPKTNDIFMTRITAGIIGKCKVVESNDPLAYYVSVALIRPNSMLINSRFLKYFIESIHGKKELNKRILHDATPPKINKDDIGKIKIKFPSLAEQERIVAILDRFDKLCNDITTGLPAEIEARQKQYEYYRDKLLTFKRKEE